MGKFLRKFERNNNILSSEEVEKLKKEIERLDLETKKNLKNKDYISLHSNIKKLMSIHTKLKKHQKAIGGL